MDPVEPNNAKAVIEKLRLKFSQKPWSETMKLVHLCMDKSHQATSTETSDSPISICLEKIQRTLNESLSTVMIRLELLSKQKGLNYHVSPRGGVCYITSESFYIEIHLEVDGKVKDVKLAHPGKSPQTCEDLLQLLRMNRYDSLGKTLEELLSIYQIPGSSTTKASVFAALQSLEKDLCLLSTLHKTPGMDRITEILCGKIGFLTPSSGGTPLSLEFYLSQYQILEEQLTPGLQIPGRKVFVTIQATDTSHKLPLCPLIVDYPPSETGYPNFDYLGLIEENFFSGIPIDGLKPAPLHELIVQSTLSEMHKEDLMASSSCFIVSLPDCPKHSFFIDKGSEKPGLTGAMVTEIPFTHPKHVPDMIEVLRHQATYNTLISSCVSEKTGCDDPLELLHFEVSQEKATSFSVTFQHPLKESLTCVMINVLSSREIQCTLFPISEDSLNCSNDYLTRVMKRNVSTQGECNHIAQNLNPELNWAALKCTSVPILMRAIFKKATKPEVEVTQSTGRNTEESSSDVQVETTQE